MEVLLSRLELQVMVNCPQPLCEFCFEQQLPHKLQFQFQGMGENQ
jgi:hypothetical protein